MHWLADLFGPGTWGTGGNMVAWVICGIIAGLWLHAKLKAQHAAATALARLHHKQALEQSAAQHKDLMAQQARNHAAVNRRLEDHAALIASAVTAPAPETVTVNVAVPELPKKGTRL